MPKPVEEYRRGRPRKGSLLTPLSHDVEAWEEWTPPPPKYKKGDPKEPEPIAWDDDPPKHRLPKPPAKDDPLVQLIVRLWLPRSMDTQLRVLANLEHLPLTTLVTLGIRAIIRHYGGPKWPGFLTEGTPMPRRQHPRNRQRIASEAPHDVVPVNYYGKLRTCEECGIEFRNRWYRPQRFCGMACRAKYMRARFRESRPHTDDVEVLSLPDQTPLYRRHKAEMRLELDGQGETPDQG